MRKKVLIAVLASLASFAVILTGYFSFKAIAHNKRPYKVEDALGKSNILPVAIIGSGPAGLSAAVYTSRAKLKTIVFTGHEHGGQLAHVKHIENWPGKEKMTGSHIMNDLQKQAQSFGTHIINQAIKKINFTWPFELISDDGTSFHALSLIIATGSTTKKPAIEGFEKYWLKGISTCALCDGPFNAGQDVLVVGGGESGAELARQVAVYAKKVTLITQEPSLTACATVQDQLKACKNIEILTNTQLIGVDGNEQTITHAQLKAMPTGTLQKLPINALYLGIGYVPNTELFKQSLKTDKEGYIIVQGRSQRTSIPGICAAGSVEEKGYGKAGIAAGNGMKAAVDTWHFLEALGVNDQVLQKLEPFFYKTTKTQPSVIKTIQSLEEFNEIIEKTPQGVIIDFFSPYCPSCTYVLSLLEKIAASNRDLLFYTVNVHKTPTIAQKLGINTIPTLSVFYKGKEQKRYQHLATAQDLAESLALIARELH